MRHHSNTKKFGREKNVRNALMRSLARNLIRDEKITTTLSKAKALRPYVEKLVTKARVGSVASRRLVSSRIGVGNEIEKIGRHDRAKIQIARRRLYPHHKTALPQA